MNMKKQLLAAVAVAGCLCGAMSDATAQTANFVYNDGNGVPDAGTYIPGDSFTFSINLVFTSGGSITNLDGLSYWFQQKSPGSPFIASITLRDVTGSPFSDLQTPGLTYPQNLNPSNANDLGGAVPVGNSPLASGTYLVANITIQISGAAPNMGTFVLDETLTGGKTSVISDSLGNTFAIAEADYTITMIPEPGTWAAAVLSLLAIGFTQRRRFARRRKLADI
jgi:hypothetical protein